MLDNHDLPEDPVYVYDPQDPFRDGKLLLRTIFFGITVTRALVRLMSPAPIALERVISQHIQRMRSFDWQSSEATAEAIVVEERCLFHAEISYSYTWENERYGGRFRRAFGSELKAKLFCRRFSHHELFRIRVNQRNPESSVVA